MIQKVNYHFSTNEKFIKLSLQNNGNPDNLIFNGTLEALHEFSQAKVKHLFDDFT